VEGYVKLKLPSTDNSNLHSLFSESAFQTFGQNFRSEIQKVPIISARKKYKNSSNIDYLSSFRSKVRLNDIKCDNVMLIIERIWRKNKNSLQPPTSRTRKPKVFVFSEANQETMN